MTQQITTNGHLAVHNFIATTYNQVSVHAGATEKKRITVTPTANEEGVEYRAVINNADSFLQDVTVDSFKVTNASNNIFAEGSITSFTFENVEDELTLVINIDKAV